MTVKFREPVNVITHLIGAALSFIATLIMVVISISNNSILGEISSIIFGLSLIGLYSASSIYHWVNGTKEKIMKLKKIDHMMIFVLISGTYTPICLMSLPKPIGLILLISMWAVTLSGVIFKLVWINAPRWLYTALYVIMGWAIVLVFPYLTSALTTAGIWWLASGGIMYTIGALIYGLKKSLIVTKLFGFHEQFHIFVILGSLCHVICILTFVLN